MPKREFRPTRRDEVDRLADLVIDAYPGFFEGTKEERDRLVADILKDVESPEKGPGGNLYEDGELIASCLFHRYEVNVRGSIVQSAGLGGVCVALDRKKEQACADMMRSFLAWARTESRPLAMLYPFNPAFYGRMGFGFGTKMHRYSIPPAEFRGEGKRRVRLLGPKDAAAIHEFYDAHARRTHGLVLRRQQGWEETLKSKNAKVAGCFEGGKLAGYAIFRFRRLSKDNPHMNNLLVRELVHSTPAALSGLMAFFRSQADQFRRVELDLQDGMLHHLFADPRDGSPELLSSPAHPTDKAGIGLMYKVHDPKGFLEAQRSGFGPGSLTARFVVADSFDGPEAKVAAARFDKGRCEVVPKGASADIEVRMDAARFSSMAMGCVPLSYLVEAGAAEVDREKRLAELDAVMRTLRPPVCFTTF